MPRVTRNFWLTGTVRDGQRERSIKETGPTGQDGTMSLRILVREDGRISDRVLRVDCKVTSEGVLKVEAYEEGNPDDTRVTIATLR